MQVDRVVDLGDHLGRDGAGEQPVELDARVADVEEPADQGVPERLGPRPVPPLPARQLDQGVDDLGPEGLAGRVAMGLGRRVPQGRGAELGVVAPDLGQPVPPLDQHVVDQRCVPGRSSADRRATGASVRG